MNLNSNDARIVVVGGGTGLSTMLRGLKKYTSHITAVVTVADDGGGSGVLREELHMLPPGDIRSCILALSSTEPLMEKLIRFRFPSGRLTGQSFGNLFLAAMNEIFEGDFVSAIQNVGNVLNMCGKVLPVTMTDVELVAEMQNGDIVCGESKIGKSVSTCGCPIRRVSLRAKNKQEMISVVPEVHSEIQKADLIVLGPGSLYTSVLPNLAVPGFAEMIHASGKPVVYINNIMTQPGETNGYSAFDHANAILEHTMPGLIHYCIANCQSIDTPLLSRYIEQDAEQVVLDEVPFKAAGIQVIRQNMVAVIDEKYIRHNTDILAQTIMKIAKTSLERHNEPALKR